MTAGDGYLKTIERMEPDITPVDHAGAMASIAISAKRSADALERIADAVNSPNDHGVLGWNILNIAQFLQNWTHR